MQGHGEIVNEPLKVLLAFFGNFFEVDDDARFVFGIGEVLERLRKLLPRSRAGEHFRHFIDLPILAVVIVDHGHDGQLDAFGFN